MTTAQDTAAYNAAVKAAMPYMVKENAPKPGADKFAVSRAKHAAISSARALASAIAVDPTCVRNPERPVVKAALKAYNAA